MVYTVNQNWDSIRVTYSKSILFELWNNVETGRFDARSHLGDYTLRLKDALYTGDSDDIFNLEYENWKHMFKK